MADKAYRFSFDNSPAAEGGSSASEDSQQMIERLLLAEPADERERARWEEEYLAYGGGEAVWPSGKEAVGRERWVEAYLEYYGNDRVWPRASERRVRRPESWVQAYLDHYGEESEWSRSQAQVESGERWVREYLAYYDQDGARQVSLAAPVPMLKAASLG